MSRSIFVALVVLCVVVSSKASKCQDAVVANLGVSAEEAKSMCSACAAVLPSSQCTSCFRAAKTLLAAAQCPSDVHVTTRKLLQDTPRSPRAPRSPHPSNHAGGDAGGSHGAGGIAGGGVTPDSISILVGKKL